VDTSRPFPTGALLALVVGAAPLGTLHAAVGATSLPLPLPERQTPLTPQAEVLTTEV